jgi:uncharacterized membrane protein
MTRSEKLLCAVYAIIAVIALIATQTNNAAFFSQPDNGGLFGYIRAMYANPAMASATNDLLLFALAGWIFMAVEGRRLHIRFVWLYIFLSVVIAISAIFPLFLIAREIKLSRQRSRDSQALHRT